MASTVYIDIRTTDPAFNLALEQYVFDRMPRDRQYFLLWQNENAVIIGKHQNTLAATYAGSVKADAFYSRVRKYKSSFLASLRSKKFSGL